jgi:hypothetical protein
MTAAKNDEHNFWGYGGGCEREAGSASGRRAVTLQEVKAITPLARSQFAAVGLQRLQIVVAVLGVGRPLE